MPQIFVCKSLMHKSDMFQDIGNSFEDDLTNNKNVYIPGCSNWKEHEGVNASYSYDSSALYQN